MKFAVEIKWESIGPETQRAKAHGGWLLRRRNLYSQAISNMVFVPDKDYAWTGGDWKVAQLTDHRDGSWLEILEVPVGWVMCQGTSNSTPASLQVIPDKGHEWGKQGV